MTRKIKKLLKDFSISSFNYSGGMGGGQEGVPDDLLTTKGDTHGFTTENARVPIGANTTVLTADSTEALGLKWAAASGAPTTTKGDVSGFSTTQARIPIGTNNQVLTADSTEALGLKWAAAIASGLVVIWSGTIGSYPAGWALNSVGIPNKSLGLSQLTQNDGRGLYNGQPRTALGQEFNAGNTMVGKNLTAATFYLYKTGSPTGSVNAYIKNSSGVIRETSSTTLNPATLTAGSGNATANEFTFAGTTTLAVDDMITIEYPSGSAGNELGVRTDNSGAIANSTMRQYTGSWADVAGEALTFVAGYELAYIQRS